MSMVFLNKYLLSSPDLKVKIDYTPFHYFHVAAGDIAYYFCDKGPVRTHGKLQLLTLFCGYCFSSMHPSL